MPGPRCNSIESLRRKPSSGPLVDPTQGPNSGCVACCILALFIELHCHNAIKKNMDTTRDSDLV